MYDDNSQDTRHTGTGGAGGTGTQTASQGPVKVATNAEGAVEIGVWSNLPPGYAVLGSRDEIISGLMNFNATELREKIADLCGF